MENKTLESLVPPMDLCKRLFARFDDSAMVWASDYTEPNPEWIVIPRRQLESMDYVEWCNAPTLAEIMMAIVADGGKKVTASCIPDRDGNYLFSVDYYAGTLTRIDRNPAASALLVLFDLKGRRRLGDA